MRMCTAGRFSSVRLSVSTNLFLSSDKKESGKEVRCDEDLRKSYLKGRMGGVPRILLPDILDSSEEYSEEEAER